jgi:methyl-accepting chemotaxis protein
MDNAKKGETITGKGRIYLVGILPVLLPFFISLILIWYGGHYGSSGASRLLANPLTALWLLTAFIAPWTLISSGFRKVDTWKQYQNEVNSAKAQRSMSKISGRMIGLTLGVNLLGSQVMILFLSGIDGGTRLAVAGATYAAIFLTGVIPYIYFIRFFEHYGRAVPLDKSGLSLSYIARNALVLFFSISAVVILILVESYSVIRHYEGSIEDLYRHLIIKAGPLALTGIFLGLMSNILLARGIGHRLGVINTFVNGLAEGNLRMDSLEIMSRDEIGLLFRDLNVVQESLKGILLTIRKSTDDTINIKDQLVSISQETSSTTVQIASNIESVNKQINNLDDSMGSSTKTVESMSKSLGDLGEEIGDQAAMVEESSAAITEMIASIDSISGIAQKKVMATETLLTVSEEGSEKLGATLETLKIIFSSIENIKDITSIIMGIAARTNLLSMNAAIEAAHAGDAGRGFSVVADEIRKLAETSSKSSRKINDNIKEIIGQIEQSSRAAEGTMTTFQSVRKEVREVVQSFKEIERGLAELKTGSGQILQASTGLQEISTSVRDKTEEMLKQTGNVSGSVSVLARISSETRGAAGEISHGTGEILQAIEQLNNRAAELDRYSSLLKQNVDKFRI